METKLKFKVGDKVRVRSLEWYNSNKNIGGEIIAKEGKNFGVFHPYMHSWCGDVLKIEKVKNGYYYAVTNGWKWRDWMLEDEPVTEEKQEDIQEEKKEEKRNKIVEASLQPITKEEAKKLLIGTKFFCTAYADTDKLQKKLFECGCEWSDIGKKINIERWAIFVNAGGILTHENKEVVIWCDDSAVPILIDDVLAIKIKEKEKPKFDPQTLQPFDKVLVRNKECDKWRCNLFCHINNELMRKYFCAFTNWIYCIPFNDETKHLVGTTEDAPEFYRI